MIKNTHNNNNFKYRWILCAKKVILFADELRHFMGSDTVRFGVTRVFDMFQYRSLNRRLIYVILEGIIETLFPKNKFKELFRKLHSQSARLKADMPESMQEGIIRRSSMKS